MHPRTLRAGEFFGTPLMAEQLGTFSLSLWRIDGPGSLPWHRHERPYVTFVVRGGYRERLSSGDRACNARAVVMHAPGELHADDFTRSATCLSIESDSRFDYDDVAGVIESPTTSFVGDRMFAELQAHDAFSPIVIEGLMLEMFGEAARARVASFEPRWLRDVRDTIATNFDAKLTLAALARGANVHPAHLARAFRRHYGRTVGESIRASRVEKAKERIAAGEMLSNVAIDCGFSDQSHLTRTFRRLTGMTPAAFQRANRVQDAG